MKRLYKLLVLLSVLFICLIAIPGYGAQAQDNTLTKKEVKSKISKLEKEVKELQSKYDRAKEDDDKLKKKYNLVFGQVISYNPYIVEDSSSLFYKQYYWVLDSSHISNAIIAASGYVKPTGNYRVYNGVTCIECNSVDVSNEYSEKMKKIKNEMSPKEEEIKLLKYSLTTSISTDDDLKSTKVTKGKKVTLKAYRGYDPGDYNKIVWSSSNTDVATVNKDGVVKGIKTGKTTITAKCSISGKKIKFKVTVEEPVKKIKKIKTDELITFVYDETDKADQLISIPLTISPSDSNEKYSISCDFNGEKAVIKKVKDKSSRTKLVYKVIRPGEATITINTASGLTKTINIYVSGKINQVSFFESSMDGIVDNKAEIGKEGLSLSKDDYKSGDAFYLSLNYGSFGNWLYDTGDMTIEYDPDVLVMNMIDAYYNTVEFEILKQENTVINVITDDGHKSQCFIHFVDD